VNFLFAIKLTSDFYKVQISTNYEKLILYIRCPFHSSYKTGYHFSRRKRNSSYKNVQSWNQTGNVQMVHCILLVSLVLRCCFSTIGS